MVVPETGRVAVGRTGQTGGGERAEVGKAERADTDADRARCNGNCPERTAIRSAGVVAERASGATVGCWIGRWAGAEGARRANARVDGGEESGPEFDRDTTRVVLAVKVTSECEGLGWGRDGDGDSGDVKATCARVGRERGGDGNVAGFNTPDLEATGGNKPVECDDCCSERPSLVVLLMRRFFLASRSKALCGLTALAKAGEQRPESYPVSESDPSTCSRERWGSGGTRWLARVARGDAA